MINKLITPALVAGTVGLTISAASLGLNWKGMSDTYNSPQVTETRFAKYNFHEVSERCQETVPILSLANPYWAQEHSKNAKKLLSERDNAIARINTANKNAEDLIKQSRIYSEGFDYSLYATAGSLALLAFGIARRKQDGAH